MGGMSCRPFRSSHPPTGVQDMSSIRAMYEAAIAQPPGERQAWLMRHCPDVSMRDRIFAMLDLSERSAGNDTPSIEALLDALSDDEQVVALPSGGRIGPFELTGVLGHGGFSTVYRGRRECNGVFQEVAIKLLHHSLHAPDAQRRFRREQRVLAQLQHPNIARLIEGGVTESGLPYIALELVEGERIDTYACRRQLGLRARLELFLVVCDAVEAAHRALIVHRDLKPGNVLVTCDGQVKLLDFGIAKLLEEAEGDDVTRTGHQAFTPAYAAPEQRAGAAVTTATDVYALGVLLGELLSGQRLGADTGSDPDACISGDEPPGTLPEPAPAMRRHLRGDLGAILRKALAPEPEHRYASATGLAEDVRRVLRGHPVSARRATRWYRTQRFVQRHRVAVLMAAGMLLSILAGSSLALWQAVEARHESRRANAMRDFMVSAFGQAAPSSPGDGPPRITDVVQEAVLQARNATYLDADIRTELSLHLGTVLRDQGALEEATEVLSQAVREASDTAGGDVRLLQRLELELLRTQVQAQQDIEGLRLSADAMLARLPVSVRELRGAVLVQSSLIALRERNLERSLSDARAALALARAENDPDLLGQALSMYAQTQLRLGNMADAHDAAFQVLDLREKSFGPTHWRVATAHANLSRMLRMAGDLDRAEHHARTAVAIDDAVLKPDDWRRGQHISALVMILIQRHEYEAALELARESARIARAVHGDTAPAFLVELSNIAAILLHLDRPEDALPHLTAIDTAYRERFGPEHPQVIRTQVGLGVALGRMGEVEAGLERIRHAIASYSEMEGLNPDELATACWKQARLALDHDRPADAVHMADCIDGALADIPQPDRFWLGRVEMLRAELALAAGNFSEALALLDDAADGTAVQSNDDVSRHAEWHLIRAHALLAADDTRGARTELTKGQALLSQLPHPPSGLRHRARTLGAQLR